MNCPMESQESSALLLAFSSNRLDPDKAVPVQRHVETCSACQQFLAGQAAVWEALDMWKPEPVSADFDRRLYQRIDQHVSWWDLLLRPFRPAALSRGLPIAAAAGVLIMAGLLESSRRRTPFTAPTIGASGSAARRSGGARRGRHGDPQSVQSPDDALRTGGFRRKDVANEASSSTHGSGAPGCVVGVVCRSEG